VILSAGAYNYAQLLFLSGVGPASERAAFGIKLIGDLPVGENLHEHAGAGSRFLFGAGSSKDWERYWKEKKGPLPQIGPPLERAPPSPIRRGSRIRSLPLVVLRIMGGCAPSKIWYGARTPAGATIRICSIKSTAPCIFLTGP
jgi:hypothetical protein